GAGRRRREQASVAGRRGRGAGAAAEDRVVRRSEALCPGQGGGAALGEQAAAGAGAPSHHGRRRRAERPEPGRDAAGPDGRGEIRPRFGRSGPQSSLNRSGGGDEGAILHPRPRPDGKESIMLRRDLAIIVLFLGGLILTCVGSGTGAKPLVG